MSRPRVAWIVCMSCQRPIEAVAPPDRAQSISRVSPWALADHEGEYGHQTTHVRVSCFEGRFLAEVPHG